MGFTCYGSNQAENSSNEQNNSETDCKTVRLICPWIISLFHYNATIRKEAAKIILILQKIKKRDQMTCPHYTWQQERKSRLSIFSFTSPFKLPTNYIQARHWTSFSAQEFCLKCDTPLAYWIWRLHWGAIIFHLPFCPELLLVTGGRFLLLYTL